jgi:Zn-dependent peptidase ImmA (M78 family)/transcriptional regulator with XRE-family HTH domain
MDTPTVAVNIGLRIKHAREILNLTQEQVSVAMGFNDRQTLSDVEKGKRSVKADELVQFGDVLNQELEFFLDPFSVVAEAQYSWRASTDVTEDVLNSFEARAGGWVGMQRWLRAQSPCPQSPLGFLLRLDMHSTFEQVQAKAEQLGDQLQLGTIPALKLADCIEKQLDIPVLFVDVNTDAQSGTISGAACHLAELGVILVNRRESTVRRNFDLAHELFHSLTWERMKPDHRESNSSEARQRTKRGEQLADNFATALLMPKTSLDALIYPARQKDVKHLADVAAQLRVSVGTLGWRLRALGRIDESTRKSLLCERRPGPDDEMPKLFAETFVKQLHTALDKGRLTARKAAKALGLPLQELAQLFVAYNLSDPFKS